jgi:hypothetical protein
MTTMQEMAERAGMAAKDAARAIVLAAAISKLLDGEDTAIAGGALGLALGKWVKGYGPHLTDQETALERVLAICARAAHAK